MDLKDSQYQTGIKFLSSAQDGLQMAISAMKRKEEASVLRRRIEEVEFLLKKAKRELRLG